MRELNGPVRGLLKNVNRSQPLRRHHVVFDETRNEFFEADYIILIREDCTYTEEDEEPCTCGEHELLRLCNEEGCQCSYADNVAPQSPKYSPPIEFVDNASVSPPDGYKDNGLKVILNGALTGHVFGAQHIQQLQVIQRLQQQRVAMLVARNPSQISPTSQHFSPQSQPVVPQQITMIPQPPAHIQQLQQIHQIPNLQHEILLPPPQTSGPIVTYQQHQHKEQCLQTWITADDASQTACLECNEYLECPAKPT